MSPEILTLLMFISVFIGILLGFPIAFVLGGLAAVFGYWQFGMSVANLFMLRLFSTLQDTVLVAIPLFVFMGVVLEQTGIAAKLYDAIRLMIGRLPGGLGVATIITATIFAAATGVVGASVVTIGLLAIPSMLKYNYSKSLATGAICAGGTLGILIPPSILIIVYGPLAGISVGQLFAAAILPGLLLSVLYVLYTIILCSINPAAGPPISKEEFYAVSGKEKFRLFATSVLPVSLIILAVLGTIFFGLAAPTEAAGVGALAAMVLAAFYKRLTLQTLWRSVHNTLRVTSMVYLVLIGAAFFTNVFTRIGGGRVVRSLMLGLPFGRVGIFISMMLFIFLLGMFIDWLGILMISVPLFTPIAAELGFDPLWFALMVMMILQTSFMTPPFAYSIFYLKGVSPPEVKTTDIYRGVVPFIALQFLGILLVYIFPEIALWLPRLMR